MPEHLPTVSSDPAFGAVILLGATGNTAPERLVHGAQFAVMQDLIALLEQIGLTRIVVGAPDHLLETLRSGLVNGTGTNLFLDADPQGDSFHFGRRLSDLITRYQLEPALYFGAGSTPLFDYRSAEPLIGILESAWHGGSNVPPNVVLTNNLHSSDWFGISRLAHALPILHDCDRDNSAAWMLSEAYQDERRFEVRNMAGLRPTLTFDIDTPTDLALLAEYPNLSPNLGAFLGQTSTLDPLRLTLRRILALASGEGHTIGLFGRLSPLAWNAFNKQARCWTRVNAEERGMVASGRLERRHVQSMLKPWIDARGVAGFFDDLSGMMDALIWDNRALWAAMNIYPTNADRFAADMLLAEQIQDSWLRDFTFAAREARLPVLMGGHTLVSGGLYLLTEMLVT